MAFQSDLAGAAVTLMGAVSLSTPDMMQMHEMRVLQSCQGKPGNLSMPSCCRPPLRLRATSA
ncbi:hypothetical protein [Synechococcus sp. BIOS-E4-1]|uniref:hypothetical protein n=1 Tax=Synechococcus sp. BIOS-E4-1 TaxID=1400864 RepID=UPI001644E775|nr:hypothetical protein [Synechococcus sp. BIOS-E4-1]